MVAGKVLDPDWYRDWDAHYQAAAAAIEEKVGGGGNKGGGQTESKREQRMAQVGRWHP